MVGTEIVAYHSATNGGHVPAGDVSPKLVALPIRSVWGVLTTAGGIASPCRPYRNKEQGTRNKEQGTDNVLEELRILKFGIPLTVLI